MQRIIILLLIVLTSQFGQAEQQSNKLVVFCSGGLRSSIEAIAHQYQQQTGISLEIKQSPSMGGTPQSIPKRLARGEPADVLVLVADAIAPLQANKWVVASFRKDIADSYIAMAVKEGALVPKIDTIDELRQVLLAANSIAYSDSASGKYLSHTLFKKLGIEKQLKTKAFMVPATPVGEIIAQGEAEIGFQQYSELLPIKGIHIVGLIPDNVQKITKYAAIIVASSEHQQQATAFINYLTSKQMGEIIKNNGLKPIVGSY